MVKLVCYGVRKTEVKYFKEINKKFGYDLKLIEDYLNEDNADEALGAEAIMVRGNCICNRENLTKWKENGLKVLLTRTVGFDHIDLDVVKELGIPCARVPGYSPNAIAELAVTLAMMLLRHTAYAVDRTSKKNFLVDPFMFSKEIRNCTVGIIGAGRIGLTAAKLFKGLGARVVAYDVFQSDAAKEVVEFMELDQLLAESDVISMHMPYIKGSNDHMINKDLIAKMKDGAILVNTGRGEVQDANDIMDAIESGKLGGFGTDVIEYESDLFFQDLSGQELKQKMHQRIVDLYPKVLITPHIGSYTDEALCNMIEYSYENLRDILEDKECKNRLA
ncbi:MAG: lactate dehydrogenase [Clostridium sp.]|uniref:2-hydroxyacid dehydrogenase n=1 Tax=Clostridium sp. DSM 8431 TaxID=1761781 RepID=UPI0008ECC922|nr:2-hydroxyacid dehydrogenase [Clostridium sp. DSM 8431]MCR4943417.1 lactate dehydrogenase [Clostridium sp.]SFU48932.1 D-lactate dehydrogenase [Clostridium sp. DSM 8431]